MKAKPHTSLKDLAAELNVSISTVSRALKNSPEVSAEMREKVKALAKSYNYRPNPFALSLLKNSPRIIGILVPDIVTYFFSSIISGINDIARANGYSVIICSSYEKMETEKQIIDDFINIRVEGIIACISQETSEYEHFKSLYDLNIPLVFYDRVCMTDLFSSVVSDNVNSAREITEHLLNTGSKRVAFIGGPNHLEIVKQRKHGYLQVLRDRKIPIEKELVYCRYMGHDEGYEGTIALLNLPNPPDAILAMNDSLAFGAMRAIKERNLRIPQDVALVGYTDELHCNYVEPALTAVTHQTHKMGEEACNLLLKIIKGYKKVTTVVVPSSLDIRQTSDKNRQK